MLTNNHIQLDAVAGSDGEDATLLSKSFENFKTPTELSHEKRKITIGLPDVGIYFFYINYLFIRLLIGLWCQQFIKCSILIFYTVEPVKCIVTSIPYALYVYLEVTMHVCGKIITNFVSLYSHFIYSVWGL